MQPCGWSVSRDSDWVIRGVDGPGGHQWRMRDSQRGVHMSSVTLTQHCTKRRGREPCSPVASQSAMTRT
eukprot:2565322-Rhodomonas_salina.2